MAILPAPSNTAARMARIMCVDARSPTLHAACIRGTPQPQGMYTLPCGRAYGKRAQIEEGGPCFPSQMHVMYAYVGRFFPCKSRVMHTVCSRSPTTNLDCHQSKMDASCPFYHPLVCVVCEDPCICLFRVRL